MSAPFIRPNSLAWLMMRDAGRCYWCGCRVEPPENNNGHQTVNTATREHLIPKTRGGGNLSENLVLACFGCNNLKDDMTGEEFIHLLKTGELHPDYVNFLAKTMIKRARAALLLRYRDA